MTPQTLLIDSEERRARAIKVLSLVSIEKPLEVTVKPYIAKRSESQNARLWLLHTAAANHTGMSAEDMHEIALCRFFGFEEKTVGGIIRQIPLKRSSARDKKEFGEFMEATEAFYISELGVWLQ